MVKTAVITLKDSPNYGGILQAYALQKVIKKLGYECVLIDYMNDEFRHKFSFFGKPQGMSTTYWIFKKLQYPLMKVMMKRMMPFYNHMEITRQIKKPEELAVLNKEFDIFITGSDQVWACDLNYYDDSYFLSFVADDHRKISYAASFGRTADMLKPEESGFIASKLKHINAISVREESGIDIVKELSDREAAAVLDPTFLLDRKEWEKIANHNHKGRGKKYILCYLMQSKKNDREALNFAKKMSKKTGFPIIKICRGLTSILWGETFYIPTVEEWIGLFLDAEYIITNSFHGMAFSVNFNKNFLSFIEGDPKSGRNSRVYDRCKDFGLLERVHIVGSKEKISMKKIDYKSVNRIKEVYKSSSIKWLKEQLDIPGGGGIR